LNYEVGEIVAKLVLPGIWCSLVLGVAVLIVVLLLRDNYRIRKDSLLFFGTLEVVHNHLLSHRHEF
jgi:hypothetical protein